MKAPKWEILAAQGQPRQKISEIHLNQKNKTGCEGLCLSSYLVGKVNRIAVQTGSRHKSETLLKTKITKPKRGYGCGSSGRACLPSKLKILSSKPSRPKKKKKKEEKKKKHVPKAKKPAA
jgi:hypothetical protein